MTMEAQAAPWKAFLLVEGGSSRPLDLEVPAGSAVGDFCDQLAKRGLFPADLDVVDLKVFANRKEEKEGRPLLAGDSLDTYGVDAEDPIIVKVPQVWFKLTKTDRSTPFAGTAAASLPLVKENTVEHLRNALVNKYGRTHLDGFAANELHVFNGDVELDGDSQIDSLGQKMKEALIVTVPAPRTRGREETKEEADESPAKRHRTAGVTEWVWREEEPVYSVLGGRMAFVNREHATEQLLAFHRTNYNRAVVKGGPLWVVPLVDNVFGLGKSTFGQEYIRRCKQMWAAHPKRGKDSFLDTLTECHTIQIQFSPMDLLDSKLTFKTAKADATFVQLVRGVFEQKYGGLPRALSPQSLKDNPSLYLVFASLTKEVGPLFIVIDEIGAAFNADNLGDIAKRERFMEFCTKILWPLFPNHKLFFLIAGRASFLSYVGLRLTAGVEMTSSTFEFQRLSLNLLRPPAIEKIIKETNWDDEKKKTIKDYYGLNDDQVTKIAARLFQTTFGHPRSLLEAFKKCDTADELENFNPTSPLLDGVNWQHFRERLWKFEIPLRELMRHVREEQGQGKYFNLSKTWRDQGGRDITYDIITNIFGIAWEGESRQAKIYIPQYIQYAISIAFYPFRKMLEIVATVLGEVAIDHPDQFEYFCLARFQELFSTKIRPCDKLRSFFLKEQLFGNADVEFPRGSYFLPKFASNGKDPASMASATAKKEKAGPLLTEIYDFALENGGLVLKPLPRSSSPDVLLISTAGTPLLLGLAVKNYTLSSKVNGKIVREECKKFSRLCTQYPNSATSLKVLIVCATSYDKTLQKLFNPSAPLGSKCARYSMDGFEREEKEGINEVIILDLTTKKNRAEFFGIDGEKHLVDALEGVITKTAMESTTTRIQ